MELPAWSSTSIALLALVLLSTFIAMGLFNWGNHFPVEGRTIVLTGASQGMGKSTARMLSEKGANVILVARDEAKLAAAKQEAAAAAKSPHTQRFHAISADVTSPEENARILLEATSWNNGVPPDIVWAMAGAAAPTLFLDSSYSTMHKQMDVNYWSCAYIATETLRLWTKSASTSASERNLKGTAGKRHLIFTSSSVAFCGIAGYAPYAPSKAAIRALSDCLRSEINFYNGARRSTATSDISPPPVDIEIHTVFPGTIKSPGLELENSTKHDVTHILEDVDPVQTPDAGAAAAIAGLERGEYLVVTNWLGRLMRGSAWMGSPRSNWLIELLTAWLSAIVWLFIGPDMERTVWNYGKRWGLKGKPKDA